MTLGEFRTETAGLADDVPISVIVPRREHPTLKVLMRAQSIRLPQRQNAGYPVLILLHYAGAGGNEEKESL